MAGMFSEAGRKSCWKEPGPEQNPSRLAKRSPPSPVKGGGAVFGGGRIFGRTRGCAPTLIGRFFRGIISAMNRLLLLLLLAACAAPLAAQTPPDPFALHIQAAQAASRAGLPLAAAREYRAALMLHPDDAAACDALAGQLEKAGRAGDAIAAYRETIRLDPGSAPAHNALGMLLEDRGERAAALAQYRQALALEPGNPLLHFNLAAALQSAGQLAPARAEYQAALRLKPDFAEARAALREMPTEPDSDSPHPRPLPLRKGRGEPEAFRFFSHPSPLVGRVASLSELGGDSYADGLRLERAGRTGEAIAVFRAVLARDPANAAARLHLGIALYAEGGQTQAARRQWQRVLTLNQADLSAQARRLLATYR